MNGKLSPVILQVKTKKCLWSHREILLRPKSVVYPVVWGSHPIAWPFREAAEERLDFFATTVSGAFSTVDTLTGSVAKS